MSQRAAPVAVIVVTWNSSRWIVDCLDSLGKLERPPAEVVVVDNGSTDGTARLVRERCPAAVVIDTGGNVGFCRANNAGIARTSSPFVLVLNPDTRLEPGFLEQLLPAFEDPRVGIVAGKLLRFDGRTLDSAGQILGRSRQPIDRGYGCVDRGLYDADDEVFGACGAAALYRRTMLQAISGVDGQVFDESFFAFYEDLDVAWRARRAGWKAAYRHRAVAYHARGGSTGDSGPPGRWQALRRRSPDVRFHVAKNRYLTILKNDTLGGYLRNLPFILARDAATLGVLLLTSPAVLGRLWRERGRFREALRRRRLDAARHVHHVQRGGGS